MEKKGMKEHVNPYLGKPKSPMYTLYQAALLPFFLNQIGMYFLPTEDWGVAIGLLLAGLSLFFISDEFKILTVDRKFKCKSLAVHSITYVFAFLLGIIGGFPILILIFLFDFYWAYIIFKNYERVYELAQNIKGVTH
jgi:hypothetical protein